MLLLASLTKSKWILLAPCRETSEWSRSGNGDDNGGNETQAVKNGVKNGATIVCIIKNAYLCRVN